MQAEASTVTDQGPSESESDGAAPPIVLKKPAAVTLRTLRKRKHQLQGRLVKREMRARVTMQKAPACLPPHAQIFNRT